MSAPRVDRVTAPLVPGRYYLVPTVFTTWHGKPRKWPVIGPEHVDIDFFDFSLPHYHLDARFLREGHRGIHETLVYPVHGQRDNNWKVGELPKPVWRRLKCQRATNGFNPHHQEITKMRQHFAGQQCASGRGGWICPHRKASLGSVLPDENGVITCPLHALRINAATGIVLPAGGTQ